MFEIIYNLVVLCKQIAAFSLILQWSYLLLSKKIQLDQIFLLHFLHTVLVCLKLIWLMSIIFWSKTEVYFLCRYNYLYLNYNLCLILKIFCITSYTRIKSIKKKKITKMSMLIFVKTIFQRIYFNASIMLYTCKQLLKYQI